MPHDGLGGRPHDGLGGRPDAEDMWLHAEGWPIEGGGGGAVLFQRARRMRTGWGREGGEEKRRERGHKGEVPRRLEQKRGM